ncbi:hypothetical protein M2432_004258 [Mycobacterium sp. OTB74]|nr:hypothetical protein [Mycobacterium sp. OTB74]
MLSQTVTPTLEFIPVLAEEQPSLSPEAELHALATFGGMQLLGDRWNLGVLYLQPQLRGTGLKPLWSARERLREHYLGLARTIAADTAISVAAVDLPFRLTESLVNVWSEHRTDNAMELAMHIADAGLRVLGVPEDHIRKVRTSTRKLVGRPPHPTTT